MTFQSTVRRFLGYGVVGEIVFDGPHRVQSLPIGSTNPLNNVFGRAFRNNPAAGGPASADIAAAAGVVFTGILCNPKEHVAYGDTAGTLDPTLIIPNGKVAGFLTMGFILLQEDATQVAAPVVGDVLVYTIATGIIRTQAAATAVAAGDVAIPGATVYELPQPTLGAGQPFIARLTQ